MGGPVCESGIDYDRMFTLWGERWKCLLDALATVVSGINLKLTEEQKEEFNVHFSRIFGRAGAAHGDPMKSAVARIAINICRIIGIVALMRSLDALLMATDGIDPTAAEKPTDDMIKVLLLVRGYRLRLMFRKRTCRMEWFRSSNSPWAAMTFMPCCRSRSLSICIRVISCRSSGGRFHAAENVAGAFLDLLPLNFTRSQALQAGERYGIPANTLDSLLKRMLNKGQLVKSGRGEYRFK